jgi:signal transduction histidine kinase
MTQSNLNRSAGICLEAAWFLVFRICFVLALAAAAPAATKDAAKRVLIVHSFGSAAPPFTTHSIAFETELTERLGKKVDLDEVSLDHARFADADAEEALVEYLQKRQAKWQPDLVVPVGSPAGVFVEKYRERMFPKTPILYTGMDRRRLRGDAFRNNAAFVGESFDGPGFIEDMLQLKPDTTNIVCVIGATQVERYWAAAFQRDWAKFTNRVSFTWLNDSSFDQMLEHVKSLPPRSFVFVTLLLRDAAGVAHNADEALRRIREVANAPVNGIFEHQLGQGIVGGRLYRAEEEGRESARIALGILEGEAATNFPPVIVGPNGSQYDWRELQRWKISEDRLLKGSVVKFRQASLWEQHRRLILIGLSVFVLQSALIAGLVISLRRRRKAERARIVAEAEAQRSRDELAHVNRVSTVGALTGSLAHELRQPLAAILTSVEAGRQFMTGDQPNATEALGALADIEDQGQRAADIIATMRGLLKKEPEPMTAQDMNGVTKAVLEMVRADLVARNVTPVLRLDPELPNVKGNGVQLRQVMLNLVINAVDAMAEKPANARELTIESRRKSENKVEVSVADTGPGFSKVMLQGPFEPFRTTKSHGLGLGLAICRTIITAHGGLLEAANNDDKGARVKFTLSAEELTGK